MEAVVTETLLWLQPIQSFLSLFFFSLTFFFFIFSFLLVLLRSFPWCSCPICQSYVTSSWSSEFDNLSDWYSHLLRHSPTNTIHVHVLGNIITANPQNVEYMLQTKFENYPKGKAFSTILGDLLGRGIFNVDGDLWRSQRKMASLELGSLSVRSYAFEIVSNEVQHRLLPLLNSVAGRTGEVLDLQDIFRRFSFDTICKISFGIDPGCLELTLPISEFAAAFDLATGLSARRATSVSPMVWKIKRLMNWGSERELKRAIKLVNQLADEVIRQRRKMGHSSSQDLLSRFMGSVSDDQYLRDIVISFSLAGRDTIASSLTMFFFLLSEHPEVEAKILEEIRSAVKLGGDDVACYDQLRKMHYVHAALYEGMRLYPPVQFDSKFAQEDDLLPDGTFVRKGTRVTYHPYAMGRMEEVWGSDCSEFRPERWLVDGVFHPESPFKYPVFQGGLRVCLGKEMAIMEMKTVVVSLLHRFKFSVLHPSRSPEFASGFTSTLVGGLPAQIHRRSEDDM